MPTFIEGKVEALNISPKGHIEGALIATKAGVVQLNLPKHPGPDVLRLDVGSRIRSAAELLDDEDGEHPVYDAVAADGVYEGVVARFNYARHGEVNGYHLEDGAFIHVKPDGAARLKLKISDRVRAKGRAVQGADALVIECTDVTKVARK
ncbi:MAG: hypothetical protein QM831_11800 [Kofleriaceae bacterium]